VRPSALILLLACAACTGTGTESPTTDSTHAPVPVPVPDLASPSPAPSPHTRVDGRTFPDHVIALTWDDGPDASTLHLASYLKRHRISATFFVVSSWIDGLSDDPGDG
jgi:peptidoglycan/xylan/chitin deacetylase (PgdA/CDA1 family)